VSGRHGEPMSIQTPYRDVFDGAAGTFQDEPVGDLGGCQALWATDELKRGTVHLVLLTLDRERTPIHCKWARKSRGTLGSIRAKHGATGPVRAAVYSCGRGQGVQLGELSFPVVARGQRRFLGAAVAQGQGKQDCHGKKVDPCGHGKKSAPRGLELTSGSHAGPTPGYLTARRGGYYHSPPQRAPVQTGSRVHCARCVGRCR
jgi:hypothetical protein